MRLIPSALAFLCIVALAPAGDNGPIYSGKLAVGQKGILTNAKTEKPQIMKVYKVRGDDLAELTYVWMNRRYILVKMPTKGLVDDEEVTIDYPLHVKETKKVAGRTMFYLEPVK